MYEELFQVPTVVARYRAGPYAKRSPEQFLKKARADGYSPLTLERMAWALLVVAEIVRDRGSITAKRLRRALFRQVKSKWPGHPPSRHTIKLILQAGAPWLRSMGALTVVEPKRPQKFATELRAFKEYCIVERGLSPATIASCDEAMRWFFNSLPPRVRSLDVVTLGHVDAFLKDHASRGWSRQSLHGLACRLRSFFRYAAESTMVSIPISRAVSNCRASINLRMFRGRQALNRSTGFSKTPRRATTLQKSARTQFYRY